MTKARILVVDDNDGIRAALKILLMRHFVEVELIASPKELRSVVMRFKPDVVLLDMNFYTDMNTGNEGLFCLSELKRFAPQVEVVLFTAYADIQLAVEGMKRGAFDFVVKPWDNDRLVEILKSAYNRRKKEAKPQPKPVSQMYWGEGDAMQTVRRQIERFAPTDATILITGENGTGKDVLANEIHRLSDRAMRPMVCVDAGAITETLFESELFGHVKGAFTDAHADKIGKFEQANGGTLFLDEIGNIPLHLQAKLLRVLQNRAVTRVGDTKERPIDIRLICATNKDIPQSVESFVESSPNEYSLVETKIQLFVFEGIKHIIDLVTHLSIDQQRNYYRRSQCCYNTRQYHIPYFFSLAYSVGRLMSRDLATSERLPSYWFIAARMVRSSAASRVSNDCEASPPMVIPD